MSWSIRRKLGATPVGGNRRHPPVRVEPQPPRDHHLLLDRARRRRRVRPQPDPGGAHDLPHAPARRAHTGPGGRRHSRGRTAGLRQRAPVSDAASGRRHRGRRLLAAGRRDLLPGRVDLLRHRPVPAHARPRPPSSQGGRRTRRILTRCASVPPQLQNDTRPPTCPVRQSCPSFGQRMSAARHEVIGMRLLARYLRI